MPERPKLWIRPRRHIRVEQHQRIRHLVSLAVSLFDWHVQRSKADLWFVRSLADEQFVPEDDLVACGVDDREEDAGHERRWDHIGDQLLAFEGFDYALSWVECHRR